MKNRKKLLIVLAAAAVLTVATIGGTLAYFTDKDSKQNVITLGKVDGTLSETGQKTRTDGSSGKDYSDVKPGQTLEKDPTITLASSSLDAYVRVKIDYTSLSAAQVTELNAALKLNAGWYYNTEDGYFYYNTKLTQAANKTTVFNEVSIPTNWGNEVAGLTFNMNVTAELIQADNFTPVYGTGDAAQYITAWGNVSIEQYTGK